MTRRGKAFLFTTLIFLGVATYIYYSSLTSSNEESEMKYVVNTKSNVNIRKEASIESEVIGKLKPKDTITVNQINGKWAVIINSENEGYVYSEYLTKIQSQTFSSNKINITGMEPLFLIIIIALYLYYKHNKKQAKRRSYNYREQYYNNRQSNNTYYSNSNTYNKPTEEEKKEANMKKGADAELQLISDLVSCGFNSEKIFHNLSVKKQNGRYSQIDLVAVTKIGIIVFEVKNFNGFISGKGTHDYWTETFNYGKEKHDFYNPIKQNNQHIKTLSSKIKDIPFHSVIVFYGDCKFGNIVYIPEGTIITKANRLREAMNTLLREKPTIAFDYSEIKRTLFEAVELGKDTEHQNKHVNDTNDLLGKHRVFD